MFGEIIGAASSLLGGLINKGSADDNRAAQMQMAAQNIAAQREFAQNGIRWKVDDARAAGVHPVFALGASTHSFSPVSVGDTSSSAMGDAIASAGQNIGRAVQSGMTASERQKSDALDVLTLEKAGLENDLLRTQIVQLKQKMLPPAMPSIAPGAMKTPAGFPIETDDIKQTPDVAPKSARQRFLGMELHSNPWFQDAEASENRYGEPGEWMGGIVNLPADMIYTLNKDYPGWWSPFRGKTPYRYGNPYARSWMRR